MVSQCKRSMQVGVQLRALLIACVGGEIYCISGATKIRRGSFLPVDWPNSEDKHSAQKSDRWGSFHPGHWPRFFCLTLLIIIASQFHHDLKMLNCVSLRYVAYLWRKDTDACISGGNKQRLDTVTNVCERQIGLYIWAFDWNIVIEWVLMCVSTNTCCKRLIFGLIHGGPEVRTITAQNHG